MPDIDLFPPATGTHIVLLVVAFVLSAIVGLEQQRRLKSAGLRTHTLVGVGAALFTLVSAYGFAPVLGPGVVLDPSRIAAQIASGIGFLGGGVIFVRQNVVNGLTTAASIWVTAAIGMACGADMPVVAAAGTVLYLVTIIGLSPLGRAIRVRQWGKEEQCIIHYKDGKGALRVVLEKASILGFEATLLDTRIVEKSGKRDRVEARFRFSGRTPLESLVEELSEIDGVTKVALSHADDD
ncbi:MAG TPA: MgtC/SapB family protein [Microbacteriaceae bacterium]|nr:MgtC/SapB family protein [Microbacteriaceae bacterium]